MKVTYEWYNDPYFVEREDPEFAMENPDHLTAEEFYCGYLGKIRELHSCTESDLRRLEQRGKHKCCNYKTANWFSASVSEEQKIKDRKRKILKEAIDAEKSNMQFHGIPKEDPVTEQRILYVRYMAMLQNPKLFSSDEIDAAKRAFDKAASTYAERLRAFSLLRAEYETKRKAKIKRDAEIYKAFEEHKQDLQEKRQQTKLCHTVLDVIKEVVSDVVGAYYDTHAPALKEKLEGGYDKVKLIVDEDDPLYCDYFGRWISKDLVMSALYSGQLMMSRMKKFGKYKDETLYSVPIPLYSIGEGNSLHSFMMYYRFIIGCNVEYPNLIRLGIYLNRAESLEMFENNPKAFHKVYKYIEDWRDHRYPDDVDLVLAVKEDQVPFDMVLNTPDLMGISIQKNNEIYTRGRYIQCVRNAIMRVLDSKMDSLIEMYPYTAIDEFNNIIRNMVEEVFGDGSQFPIQKEQ